MKQEKWVWMGHAGHLIVGNQCRFHLSTCVGKYVVSTVGEYWPERVVRKIHAKVHDPEWLSQNIHLKGDYFDNAYFIRFGFETIGAGEDSIYETMVFKSIKGKHDCCPFEQVSGTNLDCVRYKTADEAHKGHLKLCKKWSRK